MPSTRPRPTGFVLQVVEPHLNGPGGDMPAIVYDAGQDRIEVICGQGGAPAGATIERYKAEGIDLIPGDGLLATIEAARATFYRGFIAEEIDTFLRETEAMDGSGQRHKGVMTGEDLAGWQAGVEAPLTYDYHGWSVAKTGPWGQGPVLLQSLAILKGMDVGSLDPAGLIGLQASLSLRPGTVPGFEDQCARASAAIDALGVSDKGVYEPTMAHLSERRGDTMFLMTPGLPTSLAPGKRPRTTLTPSLASRDGKPMLAFGTPGGDQQDQWQLSLFLRLVHHDLNLQQAIDMPLFHTTHFPASFHPRKRAPGHVMVEENFGEGVLNALRTRGHILDVAPPWTIGRLTAAKREADGLLKAAATPRLMQAYAIGR
eukprot:jgi/Tetstr1/425389/TSEL_015836.t1